MLIEEKLAARQEVRDFVFAPQMRIRTGGGVIEGGSIYLTKEGGDSVERRGGEGEQHTMSLFKRGQYTVMSMMNKSKGGEPTPKKAAPKKTAESGVLLSQNNICAF